MNVAVIGCGAISELYHVPALQRLLPSDHIWLADPDATRARRLAERLGSTEQAVSDYRSLIGRVDAAIVAVPNHLHREVATELLRRGVHVLCEKPLATTVEEAEAIAAAGAASGAILHVGNVRRFFPSTRCVADLLNAQIYGRPLRFVAEDGVLFEWPSASGFFLDKERSGGGVLMDVGVHVLDQLLLWFGPEIEIRSYRDNAYGGVETDCLIEIAAGDVSGTVELSRVRRLTNTIRVECERGTLTVPLSELADKVELRSDDGTGYAVALTLPDESEDAYVAEVAAFVGAAGGEGSDTGAPGEDGVRVLRLIERCYSERLPLDEPWVTTTLRRGSNPASDPLKARYGRILVTGASGFLGTRLCEQLALGDGCTIRAMIHTYGRAIRLARLGVELVRGDLTDPESIRAAVSGCDAVVHCAIASSGSPEEYRFVTGKATRAVVDAALGAGVERFVHISSVGVHGYNPPEKEVDEQTPTRYTDDAYADGKLDAEVEIKRGVEAGLPTVVLRPTNIFGPHSEIFTLAPLESLLAGHVALAGSGSGAANTAYVDNVVHAIRLALANDAALGEIFIVSDDDGTTWRELYERYAALVSPECRVRTAPMSVLYPEPAPAPPPPPPPLPLKTRLRRGVAKQPALRVLARTTLGRFPGLKNRLLAVFLPTTQAGAPFAPDAQEAKSLVPPLAVESEPEPIEPFTPDEIPSKGFAEIQTSGVHFRADKIRATLGFAPIVPFDEAMRLTEDWLRFERRI